MQFPTTALPLLLLLLLPLTHALPTEDSTPNNPYLLTKRDTCIDYACHGESPDQDESCQNVNPGCLLCVSWGDGTFKCVGQWADPSDTSSSDSSTSGGAGRVGSTGNSEYSFGSGGGSDAGSIASGPGSLGSAANGELRKLQSSDPTGNEDEF